MHARNLIIAAMTISTLYACAAQANPPATTRSTTSPTTSPTTAPSTNDPHQGDSLCISYTVAGGIAGRVNVSIYASADVQLEPDPSNVANVARLSRQQTADVVELLRREGLMNWPKGIEGRGSWNDNYHYFLDITLDGKRHEIHAASDGPTQREAERILELMRRIETIVSAK